MKRFLVAAMMAASFVSMSGAQKLEVGITGGYGLGLGDSVGNNFTWDTLALVNFEDVYGALGNGIKVTADVTYYFNESLGIMAMGGYSTGGGYSTEFSWPTSGGGYTVKTSVIPVNLGIKIRGNSMGKIRPYAFIAPGLYFPKRDDTKSQTGASAAPDDQWTYTFSTGWGFTAGVGAVYSLTDKIGVKLEVSPTYAYANITQSTYTNGASATREIYHYMNDATEIPQDQPPDYYRHGQPRNQFTSLDFRLGMCYGF